MCDGAHSFRQCCLCVFVLFDYVFRYLPTVLKSFINHVIYHARYGSLIQSCKYHHYDILPFLTSTINSSLTSGIVPASFKTARIKPLLKKTTLNTTEIQNYRPVSLLSFLSKTLERAIANQMSSYLSSNNLLDPHQSGFKKAHSTETALLAVSPSVLPEPRPSLRFSFSSTCPQHLTR